MRFSRNIVRWGILLVSALFLSPWIGAQTTSKNTRVSGDRAVVEAKKAFEKKDLSAFLRFDVNGHVLAPYVAYWHLRTALEKDADNLERYEETVRDFVKREKETPLAQPLLLAWLKALAKKQNWVYFSIDYPPMHEDIELQCYGVSYHFQRDGDSALAAGKSLWFTGKSLPQSCVDIADVMIAKGILTSGDIRARMRLASEEANLPLVKSLWRKLPAAERVDEKTFVQAERQPLKYLATRPTPKNKGATYLVFFALENVARKDITSARQAWLAIRDNWSKTDREYGNARIAYRAARQLHPDALHYYREIGDAPLNVAQQIWHIRTALRAGDYAQTLAMISALPVEEQTKEEWCYWRARALEKQNTAQTTAEAKMLYVALSRDITFYGILAAERLNVEKLILDHQPLPVSSAMIDTFLEHPSVQRIVKLNELDMRAEMLREWSLLMRSLSDDSLHVAAQAMRRINVIDRSIAAAEKTRVRHDFSLRYPQPFENAFQDAARQHNIDIHWLYAVARQESRFVPEIVSNAGAIGLMQMMPRTANWVAKQLSVSGYRVSQLNDPKVNVAFGAFYLRHCLDDLDDSLALAAAAYNAGPGRAKRWRDMRTADGDIWVATIPFDETRDYVKKVLTNTKVYAQRNGASFSMLHSLKLVVAPPDGTTDDALTDAVGDTQGNISISDDSGDNNETSSAKTTASPSP